MQLEDLRQVYFIGIGGIGMSAIARFFQRRGLSVSGYDLTQTELTRKLESEGIAIHYGEADTAAVPAHAADLLIVYTPAVPADFAELVLVRQGAYVVKKRSEVLGMISRSMDCIAIGGTHGKTTTTTMTTHLFHEAGLAPNAFLGGIARNFDNNYVEGKSDYVIVEADEYDRSFLQLDPAVAVILSADPDHLDIYGDHAAMIETGFKAFARRVRPGGQLLVHHAIGDVFRNVGEALFTTFGIGAGDFCAQNVHVRDGAFYFDLHEPDGHMVIDLRTELPGRHNVENAVAACAVTRMNGGAESDIRRGLLSFKGIQRRFEKVYDDGGLTMIDDYAHHPTELNAAIGAARELYPDRKIHGIFQPHLFSRTQDFVSGFAQALDQLDEAVLIPIYPARELPVPGVTSQIIFDRMKSTEKRLLTDGMMLDYVKDLRAGVLLFLGAGNIDKMVRTAVATHQKRNGYV